MELFEIALITGAAATSTLCAVLWVLKLHNRAQPQALPLDTGSAQRVSFLFENNALHHVSDIAGKRFRVTPGIDDWCSLRDKLIARFPGIPETIAQADIGTTNIPARQIEDTATLQLTRNGAFLRVNVLENGRHSPEQTEQLKKIQIDLENLTRASDTTPHAIWQIDHDGQVAWHNKAYRDLYQRMHLSEPDPSKPVFTATEGLNEQDERQRVITTSPEDGQKDWYDISAMRVDGYTVFHAIDVNAVVKSEIAQRNFVQTLAKTFAQLSIGLAIFDRNGQLALFNPALIDLTDLPADFLSGRPTLMSFFDRIRENRRMPEPKNYQSWRQQISEVIAAATDGRYQETWTLETGQTYRVNGRPHPDGAIAFLIEDITAEVSLTRNFRAELELGQSLMDTFEEGLVVFSSSGVLTFCNASYRQMWGLDPENSFADVSIVDCVREWKALCKPGARWAAMTDFVLDFGESASWDMPVEMKAGTRLECTVSRIGSGATVIRFTQTNPLPAKARRTTGTQMDTPAR